MEKVLVSGNRCKQCGYCKHYCPKQAIEFSDKVNGEGFHFPVIDDNKCIGCGICYTVCPDGVFEVK